MQVLFCTSKLPGAAIIRAVTWSKWSHVALIDGDNAIEAAWPRVRVRPLADVLADHPNYTIADIPCEDPNAVLNAARSQIGKPYDLTALLGLWLHRDWQEDNKWFCSELLAWAFTQAREPLFRTDAVKRITPQHMWMVSRDLA